MTDSERDALFARARRAATPTEDDRRNVRAALSRRLGATVGATVSTTAIKAAAGGAGTAKLAGAAGTGFSALAKVLVAVAAVAAVAGGTAIGSAIVASSSRAPATPSARVMSAPPAALPLRSSQRVVAGSVAEAATPVMPRAELPRAAPPPPQAEEPASTSPRRTPLAVAAQPAAPAASAPLAAESSLTVPVAPSATPKDDAAEIALMAGVQAALRSGDAKRVLALVSEHQRLFPASAWAPEREGARVLALCTQASPGDARILGKAFLGAHPLTPLGGRVRATCGIDGASR